MCVLSHVWVLTTPWIIACQASLSMGFPRQEYWSQLPIPARSLPNPRIEPRSPESPALTGRFFIIQFSSVQFSHSVVSDSLRPHELQHARPPCPSPTPGVHTVSCPSSQWCHPAISFSVSHYPPAPNLSPASGSFPMSQLFAWDGQSIGVSSLASFLPRDSQESSPTPQFKSINSLTLSFLHSPTLTSIHDYWKNHSLD